MTAQAPAIMFIFLSAQTGRSKTGLPVSCRHHISLLPIDQNLVIQPHLVARDDEEYHVYVGKPCAPDSVMNKEDTGEEMSSFSHRGIDHINSAGESCRCMVLLQHATWSWASLPESDAGCWDPSRETLCSRKFQSLAPQHLKSSEMLQCQCDVCLLAQTWCLEA